MRTKQILLYVSLVILFCGLLIARGRVAEGLAIATLPLAIGAWLIIDQHKTILGIRSRILKEFLVAFIGMGITFYSAWILAYAGEPRILVRGLLAMALGVLILFNVAFAHYRR